MDNFDLRKFLAEGNLYKEEAIGPTQVTGVYELTTYQVEYDNGAMGYMYHLTDEDGNENDLGIDQLYFSEDGKEMKFGVDFEETDLLGSQSKQVLKGEALQIFKDLKAGNLKEADDLDAFDMKPNTPSAHDAIKGDMSSLEDEYYSLGNGQNDDFGTFMRKLRGNGSWADLSQLHSAVFGKDAYQTSPGSMMQDLKNHLKDTDGERRADADINESNTNFLDDFESPQDRDEQADYATSQKLQSGEKLKKEWESSKDVEWLESLGGDEVFELWLSYYSGDYDPEFEPSMDSMIDDIKNGASEDNLSEIGNFHSPRMGGGQDDSTRAEDKRAIAAIKDLIAKGTPREEAIKQVAKEFELRYHYLEKSIEEGKKDDRVHSGIDKDTFEFNEKNVKWLTKILVEIVADIDKIDDSVVDMVMKMYDRKGGFYKSCEKRNMHQTEVYSITDHFMADITSPPGKVNKMDVDNFIANIRDGKYASHPKGYKEGDNNKKKKKKKKNLNEGGSGTDVDSMQDVGTYVIDTLNDFFDPGQTITFKVEYNDDLSISVMHDIH